MIVAGNLDYENRYSDNKAEAQKPVSEDHTPVTRYLREAGIPFRFFRHPGQVRSLEQAAQERGQKPEQVVRSILFRLSKDEYVLVLMAGPRQISWPELRRYLGKSRVTMASEQEVLDMTGYPLGAVSPFGLPIPIRILVDSSVARQDLVSIGSGVRNTTVILSREDLFKALGEIESGNFGQD
jgi:Cys-tRNA(Pro)/Cys-tRNA(Cys) deacylase